MVVRRQARAAFAAASLKDGAATAGLHPGAEAVGAIPLDEAGLKGSLGHDVALHRQLNGPWGPNINSPHNFQGAESRTDTPHTPTDVKIARSAGHGAFSTFWCVLGFLGCLPLLSVDRCAFLSLFSRCCFSVRAF